MKSNSNIKVGLTVFMVGMASAYAQDIRDLSELRMSWSRSPRPALTREATAPVQVLVQVPAAPQAVTPPPQGAGTAALPPSPAPVQSAPISTATAPAVATMPRATQAAADLRPPVPAALTTPITVTVQTPPAAPVVPMVTPAYTTPVVAVNAPPAMQRWALNLRDRTLHRALLRWASEARYQMIWQTERDFPIESEVEFQGDFQAAIGEVMAAVAQTDYPLQAVFNHSTRTMRVLRFLEERDPSR